MTIGAGIQTAANPVTTLSLPAGAAYVLPSGQYLVTPGKYSFLQSFDASTCTWRTGGTPPSSDPCLVSSDSFNKRLLNATGTMVGAVITNAGTGYTNGIFYPTGVQFPGGFITSTTSGLPGNPSALPQLGTAAAPSVVMSAGGGSVLAQALVIVGGAINSTIVITTAGTGYTLPPTLIISNPPAGGWPATATCTVSAGGVINAVTVTNQGAGYLVAPTVTIVRHPLDQTGAGGVLTVNATLAGSGTITGISVINAGVGMTTVPTFTFAAASTTAATAIMCFTITTGVAQTGASNMGSGNIGFAGFGLTAGAATLTNPDYTTNIFQPRIATTAFNTTAAGGITFIDGGLHQGIPTGIAYAVVSNGTISAATTAVAQTVGGTSDTSILIQTDI